MQDIKEQIIFKLKNKLARIGVIGLGYVGLPLVFEIAKSGFDVIGFDIDIKKVNLINKGINYIKDVNDNEFKKLVAEEKIEATTDFSLIKDSDCISIAVPTPLDKYKQPDISYVETASREIAMYLKKGTLVVLESTTYPGTTKEIVKPILESSGLKCGQDFFLAFSPERVDPGNKLYKTGNTPKVVGGVTANCTEIAAMMYESVLKAQVFKVSSPDVAEMEKILENTFRNINIGLVNEMAILCNKMGINIWEVIEAAKTKPYGFMAFYPGPGLGGHCIPLDPFYLTYKAREYDYHTRLIETAGEINDYMPEFIVENITKILNKYKKPLNGSKVLILGAAYKKDIDDVRESPAIKIIDILEKRGAEVYYNDPYVPNFLNNESGKKYFSIEWENIINDAEIVVIVTDHSIYPYDEIVKKAKLVYDTRNATKIVSNCNEKIFKL